MTMTGSLTRSNQIYDEGEEGRSPRIRLKVLDRSGGNTLEILGETE